MSQYERSMVISIIGRPNVGKSSLFNRLMRRQHKALTYDTPGVTRDRHYGLTQIDELGGREGKEIILVDTGGFYPEKIDENDLNMKSSVDAFFNIMADHAKIAIQESDLVLFVVDIREGLSPFDEMIARAIRQEKKPMWVVANKYDSDAQMGQEIDFYNLGIDESEMFLISAAHGPGVRILKEEIHRKALEFSDRSAELSAGSRLQKGVSPAHQVVSRVALIGAPNAGKSTLLNQLIGAQRALVSDIAGTTVDPIEGFFELDFGARAVLFDQVRDDQEVRHDNHLIEQYENFRRNHPDVFEQLNNSYEGHDIIVENSSEETDEVEWEVENEEELNAHQDEYESVMGERLEQQAFDEENVESDASEQSAPLQTLRSIHIIDTAGIRKKSKVHGPIESQSVFRSLRCITESDIVIFMVDATLGIGHQDRRLMDVALEKGKSLIVCLNKMDLLKDKLKTQRQRQEWLKDMRYDVPWLHYCDLVTISAKEGRNLGRLKKILQKTIFIRRQKIPTSELNKVFLDLVETNPITLKKSGGKRFKIKYASMVKSTPPTFLLFANKIKGIPENYKRYLKNGLRKEFVLDNTPIHLVFRKGGDLSKKMKKVTS